MATKIIKYKCDYCKKSFSSKSYCEKEHEPICFHNPKSKSCIKCEHLGLNSTYSNNPSDEAIKVLNMLATPENDVIFRIQLEKYGTFHIDEESINVWFEFNKEYKHFSNHDYIPESYCYKKDIFLPKLRTNCSDFCCA